jgi:hypothetical protein
VGYSVGVSCGYTKGVSAYAPWGVAGIGGSAGLGGGVGYGYAKTVISAVTDNQSISRIAKADIKLLY